MRDLGFGPDGIAAEVSRRYRARPREAYRLAFGWSLVDAAARFNTRAAREGTDPNAVAGMTASHLCEHEKWPYAGRRPSVYVLNVLAKIYDTEVLCLLDLADHEHLHPKDRLVLISRPPARPSPGDKHPLLTGGPPVKVASGAVPGFLPSAASDSTVVEIPPGCRSVVISLPRADLPAVLRPYGGTPRLVIAQAPVASAVRACKQGNGFRA
ncbi:MAG TPA: hypothetical protein VH637_10405 [Streptosporangiaceae bacterium]|jgi:hypothetical protein